MNLIFSEKETFKYCDWSIEWCFLLFCFFLPIPHTASVKSITKLVPIFACIIKMWIKKDYSIKGGPFLIPILLLLLGASLSLFCSRSLAYSIDEIRGDVILPIAMYLVLINYENRKSILEKMYIGFGLSLLYISLVGTVCYFNNMCVQWDGRALLIFHQPNIAGMYVATLIVFFIGAYYIFPRTFPIILSITLVQLLSVFALFLTGSRESILSLIVAITLFSVYINKKFILYLLLFFTLSIPFLPLSSRTKLKSFFELGTYTNKKMQVYGRMMHWKIALKVIKKHPLFGVGYGWENSREIMTRFRNTEKVDMPDTTLYHAHNTFLEMMVEMGVFGFISAVAFVFVWIRTYRAVDKKHSSACPVFFSVVCSFVVFFVIGSVDFILRYDQIYLVWILIAIFSF